MIYLTGSWQKSTFPHIDSRAIGVLNTPNTNKAIKPGWVWAADNGCFNEKTYVGDKAWIAWLDRQPREGCLFANAPDVMGNHAETVIRSSPWLARIRQMGFPAGFVAQDGASVATIPWATFDVLFIGGSDAFKLGGADEIIAYAVSAGVPVHVGRVNSKRRYVRFLQMGCASCDGTYLAFGHDVNLPNLLSWAQLRNQTMLS